MKEKESFHSRFVIRPILFGIGGFILFFTILVLTKSLAYWVGTHNEFSIVLEDAILSLVGFILLALIKLLENFKAKEPA